jgi:hypothetical protein
LVNYKQSGQGGPAMKKANKHYKFINSATGYVIYYYSISGDLEPEKVKEELEKIRAKVAIQNGIYLETVYWEEIKDDAE